MTDTTELKRLILDERFTGLKSLVKQEINLMSILNVAHRELQHSNFLGWLFDPKESHDKKDYFLREFIKLYYKENEYQDLGNDTSLSVFDFVKLDLDDAVILREHKHIDLLITSKSNELVICIENKIFARESEGQLTRYREYVEDKYSDYKYRIYIFLSLHEQNITESEQEYYVQITYQHIIQLLENSLEQGGLSDNVEFVITQYITSLKVIMNENHEIEKLAKELYEEYKSSFDLVLKYAGSSTSNPNRNIKQRVPNNIENRISNDSRILKAPMSDAYKRFVPKELIQLKDHLVSIGLIEEDHDLVSGRLFLFEFYIKEDEIEFDFIIGKHHNQTARKRLYEHYIQHEEVMNAVNKRKTLPPKSKFCRYDKIVTKKQFKMSEAEDEDYDLNNIIEDRYEYIVGTVVPKIMGVIKKLK